MNAHATNALLATLLLSFACDAGSSGEQVESRAGHDPKAAPEVRATRVEAATIESTSLSLRFERPGEVEAAREATIASAMGGQIEAVKVKVGDRVAKGAVLARVDASLHSAQVAREKVEVDDAKRELARMKSLGESVASARLDAAETRLERAEAQLRVTKIYASRTVLEAPFAGTVADLEMEVGEVAPPGVPLARLVALDPAVISVSVTDRDVAGLAPGLAVRVTAAGTAAPREGRVARIDPTADLRTRTFLVEVEVPNADGTLLPGMIASVAFAGEERQDVIVVPQDLLVTTLDANGVFVVGATGLAEWRPLELGALVRDQVIVQGGLRAGEQVVVLGQRALSEGDPLIVARLGTCCRDGRVRFPDAASAEVVAKAGAPAEVQP